MLPMTVLRRIDSVLAPTKSAVLAKVKQREGGMEGPALETKLIETSSAISLNFCRVCA